MGKHIIDGYRKRDASERLERYNALDRATSARPGPQSEVLMRAPRARDASTKLRRFVEIERRDA